MLFVAVFALVPSLIPWLPASVKAFPELTSKPGRTLLVMVWPKANQAPPPTVAVLPDDPDKALVLPELDLTGGTPQAKSKVARGLSYDDEKEAQKWETIIKKVGAQHVDILDPCLEQLADGSCQRTAMEPFFRALHAAREPTARAPVRVVTLGTSLIASDHITDVARRRMMARHGQGGTGYLYVDRPTRGAGRDVRCGKATDGWDIDKLTDEKFAPNIGLAGVSFTAKAGDPQSVSFPVTGQRLAELFLVTQPNGGEVEIKIDGSLIAELSTAGDEVRPATSIIEVPEGSKRLELKTRNGVVRIDGVSPETGLPGVIFDALGLPGGAAYVFLRANEEVFGAQLLERRPALVILMMGGNEAFDLSLSRYSVADAKKNFVKLIARVRQYAPQAAIMLASPADAGLFRMDKSIAARKETAVVSAFLHDLAREERVAIWDMQQAMGGEGAIEKWYGANLVLPDLVHPVGIGGDVFGYLLDSAIERARKKHEAKLMAARIQNRVAPPPKRSWVRPHPMRLADEDDAGEKPIVTVPAVGGGAPLDAGTPRRGQRDGGAALGSDGGTSRRRGDAGVPDAGEVLTDGGRPAPSHFPAGPGLSNPDGLTRFFERLKHLEHDKAGRVAILQLGASHTAAQFFTDTARSDLSERFGYAGRGFVAAGKSVERLVRSGVERDLQGSWTLSDALKNKTPGERWGLTGIRAVGHPGSSAIFEFVEPRSEAEDSARVQVYVLEEPGMGPLQIHIDDRLERALSPPPRDSLTRVRVVEIGASGSHHVIKLDNPGPGDVSVLGVSHELMRPGIVYDALGLPGSTAVTFSHYDADALIAQLKARQPDLFVLFYGTNEAALPPAGLEQVRAAYPRIIANLRLAAPDAACLLLGPTDRMSKKKKSTQWRETESIDEVYDIVREVAARNDCAFWETREAMGGEGSIDRWRKVKPPLSNKDHVHLTKEGYRLLANEMTKDMIEAYEAWQKKAVATGGGTP